MNKIGCGCEKHLHPVFHSRVHCRSPPFARSHLKINERNDIFFIAFSVFL